MVIYNDEKHSQGAQTPGALRVTGGAGTSAALPLLGYALAWPALVRLASAPMAPATRPAGLLPRTVRIAVVDIAHEGLSLDFSVDFESSDGDGARGEREVFGACDAPDINPRGNALEKGFGEKGFVGLIDTDFLVSPFHLGREALFEGVAEGRRKTGSNFQTVPRIAVVDRGDTWGVWENG